ncbi:MAG: threonylcarbamoyl-AMP synthase [Bacteroidetes bacterium]|nr:MAG: threonylcarbamoyl-AMP synthase [Bacteroidota bacterium]
MIRYNPEDLKKALDILFEGGIILYPTDTIWGIGCDANNSEAVKRIYELKKREDSKSMLVLINDTNRIPSYLEEMPDIAWDLTEVSEKPLTIIYPGAKNLAANLIAKDKTIGIRVTSDPFCNSLIKKFKRPIVSTSANISGQASPANFSEISDEIKTQVDYIVKHRQNEKEKAKPSGIIQLGINGQVKVIREA